MFHTEFVGTFMMYLYTKFHMPCSSGSLVVTVKLNG